MPAKRVSRVSRARLPTPPSMAWRMNSSMGGKPRNCARTAWTTKRSNRMALSEPPLQQQHAGEIVDDEDQYDRVGDGVVGGPADAGGAAGGAQAEVAGD